MTKTQSASRHKYLFSPCLKILLLLLPFRLLASEALSLSQAISVGLKKSPELKRLRALAEQAQDEVAQNKALVWPTIELNTTAYNKYFGEAYSTVTSDEFKTYLEAKQPLYAGGALTSGVAFYETKAALARNEYQKGELLLVYQIATAFVEAAKAQDFFAAAQRNESVYKRHLDVIRKHFKIGRAKKTDYLQAELNWLTAQSTLSDAQTQWFNQQEKLRVLLATEELPELKALTIDEKSRPIATDKDQLFKKALRQSLSIQQAEWISQNTENEKSMALSADLPQLSLIGQYGYQSTDSGDWVTEPKNYSSVGVSLKIPLFSGFSSFAKRRSYEQKKYAAERTLEQHKLELDSELQKAVNNYEAARKKMSTAKDILNKAEVALQIANSEYSKGLISNSDLFNVQRTKYEADKLSIEALATQQLSRLTIDYVLNEPLAQIYGGDSQRSRTEQK